ARPAIAEYDRYAGALCDRPEPDTLVVHKLLGHWVIQRSMRMFGYLKRRPQERTLPQGDGQCLYSRERLKVRLKLIPVDLALPRVVAIGDRSIDQMQKIRVRIAIIVRLRRKVLKVDEANQPRPLNGPAGLFQHLALQRLQQCLSRLAPPTR